MRRKILLFISFIVAILPSSCSFFSGTDEPSAQTETAYTVAMILRLNEGKAEQWYRTANWALESLDAAQENFSSAIKLNLEWYDENTVNLDSLATALADREDVCCIIGPQSSGDCDLVGNHLWTTRKTIISPCATSEQMVRSFAGNDFFWSMVEPDVTQCEVLLSQLIAYRYKDISLIASTSLYGTTFIDWFAYQATEMGLNVRKIYKYDDDPNNSALAQVAEQAFNLEERDDNYAVLAAPTDVEGAKVILEKHLEAGENAPRLMFSDIAMSAELLQWGNLADFAEGVSPYADPESGFGLAYKVRFGIEPGTKEAQLYDALMIVGMALIAIDSGFEGNLNDAIKYIVNTEDSEGKPKARINCWRPECMAMVLSSIREGENRYDISGASGTLDFDKILYTTVTHSVYVHWMVYGGKILNIDYLSTDGSNRTGSALASWKWNTTVQQEFYDIQDYFYPERTDNWALVVAGSKGWNNYRHQADALTIYQILRKNGYDDEHIVFIAEDDIANNPNNHSPGSVKSYDGQELYTNVHIDYHISDLSPDDIIDILLGKRSESLPEVISSSSNSNVLVFWSGHGESGSMLMGDRLASESFTELKMESLLAEAEKAGCFRKMLWFIETCYSASVAVASQMLQTPGVMMFTAASANEPSKADVRKNGVWMTNCFTKTLVDVISEEPGIDFRRLYLELNKHTTGSHVCVLNSTNFDNLYKTNILEFIIPTGQYPAK